jgi:PEP-CTERM motif
MDNKQGLKMATFKRLGGGLLGLMLVTQAGAVVVFQDGVNTNSSSPYAFIGQNTAGWVAADQKLQSTLNASALHNPSAPGFAVINGVATSQHFRIEADIQVIGQSASRSEEFGHVGFFWGQQDLDHYSIGYLRTHADHVTAWQSPYSTELITHLGFDAHNAVDVDGQRYHLAFEVDYQTSTLIVSLDGVSKTFGSTDFGAANTAGGVGGALGLISWGERVSYDNITVTDFTASSVPEPGTAALLLPAMAALGIALRRRRD